MVASSLFGAGDSWHPMNSHCINAAGALDFLPVGTFVLWPTDNREKSVLKIENADM